MRKSKRIQNLIERLPSDEMPTIRAKCRPGSYNRVLIPKAGGDYRIVSSLDLWREKDDYREQFNILTPDDLY
jgi:hypothetical protein